MGYQCPSFNVLLCHCVTVSLCHLLLRHCPAVLQGICVSLCHCVTVSLCPNVNVSQTHYITVSWVTVSLTLCVSLCYCVTMLLCNCVTMLAFLQFKLIRIKP